MEKILGNFEKISVISDNKTEKRHQDGIKNVMNDF